VRGFTLIELVMVIVIVGILAVIAVPRFESFYAIKLDGATKKVVSDIRYAQQLAIARHEDYRVVFDVANNNYEVRRVSDGSFATDPFTRADFIVNFNTDAQYKGIRISNTNFGGTLQFDWQGIPRDGNGTALTSEGSISFSYQGNNRTIYITPDTGRVRLQ